MTCGTGSCGDVFAGADCEASLPEATELLVFARYRSRFDDALVGDGLGSSIGDEVGGGVAGFITSTG